jgi:hypothetical protein
MKKVLIGLAVLLSAHAPVSAVIFTPIDYFSLIHNGVKFFFSSSTPKEITVTATGHGKTQDEAIQNALIASVQKGLGVLIVTDQVVSNDEVTKNLAAMYSSGVVNSYTVKSCAENRCTVVANVSPWNFMRRLEGDSRTVKVAGKNLHAQAMSARYAMVQRYKITEYYLSQIRQSGLDVNVRQVTVLPTTSGDVQLAIDYDVRMNKQFRKNLIAFLETLQDDTNGKTEQNHQVYIQWGPGFNNRAYINTYDVKMQRMMQEYLAAPVDIGFTEFGICDKNMVSDGNVMTVDWYGMNRRKVLSVDSQRLKNIDKITVSVGCQV